MASSAPAGTPPPPEQTRAQTQTNKDLEDATKKAALTIGGATGGLAIAILVINVLIGLIYCYGAARLSYNTFGSMGWAVVAFLFAPLYYPYYGIFVSQPAPPPSGIFGGRSRRHK